jgi:hypothetical protein
MKKEYTFVAIIGMFLLSYLLDAISQPLSLNLATPYEYLSQGHASRFPFTTTSIMVRSLAIMLTPFFFTWLFDKAYYAKGVILLVVSALVQLYAVQDVVSNAHVVPLEWAISLAIGGAAILVPAILYIVRGALHAAHESMLKAVSPPPPPPGGVKSPDWLETKPKSIPKKT